MSLLLNYNETIDTNTNNSNRIEWTDLIKDSNIGKIIPNNNYKNYNINQKDSNSGNTNQRNNDQKDSNDDFENNRLNQNIIVNQKETFDTKNSTINSGGLV